MLKLLLFAQIFTTSTSLDWSRKNLTEVPRSIPEQETTLDLSHNHLVIIRRNDFMSLSDLVHLYLQNNNIIAVEDEAFTGLTVLKTLNLSSNALQNIPDLSGLVSLRFLLFSGNIHLQFVNTSGLTGLNKLGTLTLDYIGMKNIDPLPYMPKLTGIYLKGNNFTHFSGHLLQRCTALTSVSLIENRLGHMPQLTPLDRTIQRLFFKSNRIYHFPDLSSFQNLEFIGLQENFITTIPHYFMPLIMSGWLYLIGNPISCVTELCWLAQQDAPIVKLTCRDGTDWSNMKQEVICEGRYYLLSITLKLCYLIMSTYYPLI